MLKRSHNCLDVLDIPSYTQSILEHCPQAVRLWWRHVDRDLSSVMSRPYTWRLWLRSRYRMSLCTLFIPQWVRLRECQLRAKPCNKTTSLRWLEPLTYMFMCMMIYVPPFIPNFLIISGHFGIILIWLSSYKVVTIIHNTRIEICSLAKEKTLKHFFYYYFYNICVFICFFWNKECRFFGDISYENPCKSAPSTKPSGIPNKVDAWSADVCHGENISTKIDIWSCDVCHGDNMVILPAHLLRVMDDRSLLIHPTTYLGFKPIWLNTLVPEPNGGHFAGYILQFIYQLLQPS